jgi:peptidoglycan/xylan/chitin deacetylase (PgdA/CDA1 family)
MMIRKQDIYILSFYYLGYSRIRNLILRLQCKPVTRFVNFHDILPEAFSAFKANIYFLKRHTNVVSLDDFFSGRLSSKKINVVITFDDGYKSWLTHAVPVLKELGLPATFFVTSGFVGLSKEDEAEFMRSKLFVTIGPQKITKGLSFEDVRRIVKDGFTVGGHTLNHCNLGKLQDITQVRYEIAEDKMRLEKVTGVKAEYFAYPSGAYYNPEINLVGVLKESGYKGAVTTVAGFNNAKSNPFLLCRELTRASMPERVFRARVYGNYDVVCFIRERLLNIFRLQ